MSFEKVQDSGERREFVTGSRRDTQTGKPRIDLIPTMWIERLGVHLANGAEKYGDSNWQKGQPLAQYYTSGMRHMLAWFDGKEDEDHFAAAAWNTLAAMWTLEQIRAGKLPRELDDRPESVGRNVQSLTQNLEEAVKRNSPQVKSSPASWV